jgi:uncharacterized protein (TIGR03032 family)
LENRTRLELTGSRLFTAWLASARASLAFTTYQAGKLFLIGLRPDGRLSIFERTFSRCMGLGTGPGGTLWMSSLFQLWRFENFLEPGSTKDGYDAVYVPVNGHTTGDVDIHDIDAGPEGSPVFVVTRFNCLATLGERSSFAPLWRPPFVDRLAAEDRCHLNGLAMRDGRPAFVTCVAATNLAEAWREHRRAGGVVIDVASGATVATGLSMPHSPRLHRGRLWLVQSGTGEFGHIDLATGRFEPVCFLQGFARGLAFLGDHAVIGVSRPRENRTFDGLLLNERLAREGVGPVCHLAVVNLSTGDIEHRLVIEPRSPTRAASPRPAGATSSVGRTPALRRASISSRSTARTASA